MAILERVLINPAQRFDLEEYNGILSNLRTDSKYWQAGFNSSASYIVSGFEISNSALGQASLNITIDSSILLNPNNTSDFSWYMGFTGANPLNVPVNASNLRIGRNYIELQLSTLDGTAMQRAFWDPTALEGAGAEFSQEVNTTTELQVTAAINQVAFNSGDHNKIPVAIVDVDSSSLIAGILDRRNLFFALGTPSSPTAGYTWGSQVVPPTTLFFTANSAIAYVAGETVTFTSGATATVVTGGTNNITVKEFSTLNFNVGDTVTGGTSGGSATLHRYYENFTGADKDISSLKDMINSLMDQLRTLKGTKYWYEQSLAPSTTGLLDYINAIPVPIASGAKYYWDGSNLAISDNQLSAQADSDEISAIRVPGRAGNLVLTRQDGTGGSAVLPIADGDILFVRLPEDLSTNATFSDIGTADSNYQIIAKNSFIPTHRHYWLAYREGAALITRGFGKLESGEASNITDSSGEVQEFIPFRLYENVPNNHILNIGPASNTDSVTGNKSDVSSKPQLATFTGGNVTFPSTTGSNAVPTVGNSVRIDIQTAFYLKVMISVDTSGNIILTPGVQSSTIAGCVLPAFPLQAFAIGFVTLHNTSGAIDVIDQSHITQFARLSRFEDGNNGGGNVYTEGVDVVSSPSGNNQMAPLTAPATVTIPKDTSAYLGENLEAQVTNASNVVTVTKYNHGLTTSELVTVITSTAIGGITALNLSQTATPATVIDTNTFSYVAGANATYNDYGLLDSVFAETTRHYIVGDRTLKIYLNGSEQREGVDYTEVGGVGVISNRVQWNVNLVLGDIVDYVINTTGTIIYQLGASLSTGNLQDAYNNGNSIVTTTGTPVTITGPVGQKLLHVAGDIQIDGMIDPTAIVLSRQSSNPLSGSQDGFYFDNTGNMMIQTSGQSALNATTLLTQVQSGSTATVITDTLTNSTASTIPAFTPVYSPSAGNIAPADGLTLAAGSLVGITTEAIAPSASGLVAISGIVPGVSGYTHGDFLYLTNVAGVMSTTVPTLGPYSSGFYVVVVGIVQGTKIYLRLGPPIEVL